MCTPRNQTEQLRRRERDTPPPVGKQTVGELAKRSTILVGAGIAFGTGQAEAAPVLFHPPGAPIEISRSGQYHFDINDDGEGDFGIIDRNASIGAFTLLSDYFGLGINFVMNADGLAAVVLPGGVIGPDTTGWLTDAPLDNFAGIRGYAGVVFDIPGGSPHFGYLDIEMDAERNSVTLYGGAYESLANAPISTPVPEPTSLALLAAGAAGVATWRRRK